MGASVPNSWIKLSRLAAGILTRSNSSVFSTLSSAFIISVIAKCYDIYDLIR